MANGKVTWDWVWRVVVWGAPILVTALLAYFQLGELRTDVAKLEARVEAHERLPAHPHTTMRIDKLENQQAVIIAEQKRAAENISAICQVTGARCR